MTERAADIALIREALEYQERESLVGPLFPEALDVLDRLTSMRHTPEYLEAFYDGVNETLRQLKRDLGHDQEVDEWVRERLSELEADARAEKTDRSQPA